MPRSSWTLLLTFEEAAEQFRVSARTIRRMVDAGELPFVKIGSAVRIPHESMEEWVAANQRQVGHSHEAIAISATQAQAERKLEEMLVGRRKWNRKTK